MDRKSFVNGSLPPKWFHDRPGAYKYGLIPISSVSGMASLGDFSQIHPKISLSGSRNGPASQYEEQGDEGFLEFTYKVSGLTPKRQRNKASGGQNSFRAIIKMRRKLGITGPKGYVDYRKPRLLKELHKA